MLKAKQIRFEPVAADDRGHMPIRLGGIAGPNPFPFPPALPLADEVATRSAGWKGLGCCWSKDEAASDDSMPPLVDDLSWKGSLEKILVEHCLIANLEKLGKYSFSQTNLFFHNSG